MRFRNRNCAHMRGQQSSNQAACPASGTVRWQNYLINSGQSLTLPFAALVDTTDPPSNGTMIRSTAAEDGSYGGATAGVSMR